MMRRNILILVIACFISTSLFAASETTIKVGSKKFTESVILGEMAKVMAVISGIDAEHMAQLGGSRLLFNSLLAGEIDIYPEYTGTIRQELLKGLDLSDQQEIEAHLNSRGISMTKPLGFNNTYAIGMLPERSKELGLTKVSDLRNHPDLKFGLTNEFLDRGDGWPGLRKRYQLPQTNVTGLDHDLAYRALESGDIDVMDLYSTDAEIAYYNLTILEDDRNYFPTYMAVYLYRSELEKRVPELVFSLRSLESMIDASSMQALNKRVKLDGETEELVAAQAIAELFGGIVDIEDQTVLERVVDRTIEHMTLVLIAMIFGTLVAIPLGIIAFKYPQVGKMILGTVGVIQTIPALALLVFMIPLLGIAAPPSIAALFLYSLLPMVRNTHAGLEGIPESLRESANALGLPQRTILLKIELPLAMRSILAGIKTSFVISIGFATLGALIGAGGYGQPILTGIRLDDMGLIMEGAIPAALMAIIFQFGFDKLEDIVTPRGLKNKE